MAGWPSNYEAGKLEFTGLTLPNPAMIVIEFGFTQLWTQEINHQNRETAGATIPYPGVFKGKKASIPLVITGDWDVSGTPYSNSVYGLMTNVALINALTAATATGDGTQSATYTPYPGATPIVKSVQVMPLLLGTNATQGGSKAVLDLILPDGAFL